MVLIRPATASDRPALHRLYPEAFPDEDLLPLADALFAEVPDLVSLVAEGDNEVVGSIFFTPCSVAGSIGEVALLGPMAVRPLLQGKGIGTSLIRHGLIALRSRHFAQVQVLGDPRFYGRVGFVEDSRLLPPYPLNPDWRGAWQTLQLDSSRSAVTGLLVVPHPWQVPALWR